MRLLFLDTETTGLPKNWKAPASDVENWPRVVEFGAIEMTVGQPLGIKETSAILKPVGFTIPIEASSVHKITDEIAMAEGVDAEPALRDLHAAMVAADCIVGHNINYDLKCISAEFERLGLKYPMPFQHICTMMSSRSLFGKWPKLEQLYFGLTGIKMPEAHRALADIRATAECFMRLVAHGVIDLELKKTFEASA